MVWPFRSARARLDDEAAEWASRMQGPDRERHRQAFEIWYRSKPAHADAFDEAMAGFEDAGLLRHGELARGRRLPEAPSRAVPFRYAFGAAVAAAVVALIFLVNADGSPPVRSGEPVRYASTPDAAREIELADGSRMMLGRDTVAVVAFTRAERRISLERGRGRFSVAHGARPFRVTAGEAEVLAHGTLFDVSLAAAGVRVALIEGSVEVSYRAPSSQERRVARLEPGQQIVVERRPQRSISLAPAPAPEPQPASAAAKRPVRTMLQFDDTPLAEALAEANRRSRTTIRLADTAVGRRRVSGAFRAGDAQALADSLAAAFALRLERLPDGTLLLHPSEPQASPR